MTQDLMETQVRTPANITADDINKYICPLANDKEIFMFLQMCKMTNLNPFLREAYLVKYKADQPATMLTGYESYIKRAERSELYGGLKAWTEGSVQNGDLKGIVEVYRKDWPKPLVHEVYYEEYVQMTVDYKTNQKRPNRFWAEKPKTMIKKVAISQAFRLAFPNEFHGMPHTFEENEVELEDLEVKSTKPQIEMPKSSLEGIQNAPESSISKYSGKNVANPINQATEAENATTSEIPIVSKAQYANLRLTAKKNGWVLEDLKKQLTDLGYEYDKDYVPLNAYDFETIESFFNIIKIDYMAKQESYTK